MSLLRNMIWMRKRPMSFLIFFTECWRLTLRSVQQPWRVSTTHNCIKKEHQNQFLMFAGIGRYRYLQKLITVQTKSTQIQTYPVTWFSDVGATHVACVSRNSLVNPIPLQVNTWLVVKPSFKSVICPTIYPYLKEEQLDSYFFQRYKHDVKNVSSLIQDLN